MSNQAVFQASKVDFYRFLVLSLVKSACANTHKSIRVIKAVK